MSERLVTVGTYWNSVEAGIARSCVEAAGIRAFLSDEHLVDVMWQYANAVGGVKLQVAEADAETSREILAASDEADLPTADEVQGMQPLEAGTATDFAEIDRADFDRPVTSRDEDARRAFRAAVLTQLFPVILPLQLYVSWVLLRMLISHEQLSPDGRRKAIMAAVINIPTMCGLGYILLAAVLR